MDFCSTTSTTSQFHECRFFGLLDDGELKATVFIK
jgi:hypothetical protein